MFILRFVMVRVEGAIVIFINIYFFGGIRLYIDFIVLLSMLVFRKRII